VEEFSDGVQGGQPESRESVHQWDRREQLPTEAQGTEGVQENLLFFKENPLPPEGFQSGILFYQQWPCVTYHTFCITTLSSLASGHGS
jgi:hypothetical protein